VPQDFFCGIFLNVPQRSKIIEHLALRARIGSSQSAAFLQRAYLFERKQVALYGCRGMHIPRAGVFLQGRNPRQFERRLLNALA
jgi:hypothetical protein